MLRSGHPSLKRRENFDIKYYNFLLLYKKEYPCPLIGGQGGGGDI
jgi:hypothetical protein